MKKVLSLVLTLSLVLGTFSMAFAASYPDVKGEAFEDAVTVLSDLGVVSGYEDGTYGPEKIVTRAEMAVLVVRALGYSDVTSGTSTFTDMDGYGWAEPYISVAQGLGIISGYGDGTFRPGNTVSYDEAATMLVAALGYTPESLNGTWPSNFVDKAKTLGIMDGVKTGSAGANRGDIATMIYQTIDQAIGKVNKDGDWINQNAEAKKPNDTMLARLGATPYVTDTDGNIAAFIVTGDEGTVINLSQYVGASVTAYKNKDGDIIAIGEVKSSFLTGEFNSAFTKFTANDVEYTVNGTTIGAQYFVNGSANGSVADGSLDSSKEYTLAADVSGRTVKEVFSVMVWNISEDSMITSSEIADIDDSHELLGYDFIENDNRDIDMTSFALNGVESLKDIKADNIVYVYANGDDEIKRVDVGTETVSGEITRKTSSKITVEGKQYEFATESETKITEEDLVKVENEVKLFLDYAGDIYKVEKISGDSTYAVVMDLGDGKAGTFGDDAQIKLFLADGKDASFTVDEDANSALLNAELEWVDAKIMSGTLVKYTVDKNGVIDSIKLAEDQETSTGAIVSASGYYKGYKVDTNATIFTYAGTWGDFATKVDNYGTTTTSKLLDSTIGHATYAVDGNKIVAMFTDGGDSADDFYGVITEYGKVSGSDQMSIFIDGKETTVDTTTNYSDLLNGGKDKFLYHGVYKSTGKVELTEVGNDKAIVSLYRNEVTSISSDKFTYQIGAADAVTKTLADNVKYYKYTAADGWETAGRGDVKADSGIVRFFAADEDAKEVSAIVLIFPEETTLVR